MYGVCGARHTICLLTGSRTRRGIGSQPLFERVGRRLELAESWRIAPDYDAEPNFNRSDELLAALREGHGPERQVVRIGVMATLSSNF